MAAVVWGESKNSWGTQYTRQKNIEIGSAYSQCNRAFYGSDGNPNAPGHRNGWDPTTICYICGMPITSGNPNESHGPDCEHVVPAFKMAMICGLSNSTYSAVAKSLFTDCANGGNPIMNYNNSAPLTYADYSAWQQQVHEGVYRWSHNNCNKMKSQDPVLRVGVNRTSGAVEISTVVEDSYIRSYMLNSFEGTKWTSHVSSWREMWTPTLHSKNRAQFHPAGGIWGDGTWSCPPTAAGAPSAAALSAASDAYQSALTECQSGKPKNLYKAFLEYGAKPAGTAGNADEGPFPGYRTACRGALPAAAATPPGCYPPPDTTYANTLYQSELQSRSNYFKSSVEAIRIQLLSLYNQSGDPNHLKYSCISIITLNAVAKRKASSAQAGTTLTQAISSAETELQITIDWTKLTTGTAGGRFSGACSGGGGGKKHNYYEQIGGNGPSDNYNMLIENAEMLHQKLTETGKIAAAQLIAMSQGVENNVAKNISTILMKELGTKFRCTFILSLLNTKMWEGTPWQDEAGHPQRIERTEVINFVEWLIQYLRGVAGEVDATELEGMLIYNILLDIGNLFTNLRTHLQSTEQSQIKINLGIKLSSGELTAYDIISQVILYFTPGGTEHSLFDEIRNETENLLLHVVMSAEGLDPNDELDADFISFKKYLMREAIGMESDRARLGGGGLNKIMKNQLGGGIDESGEYEIQVSQVGNIEQIPGMEVTKQFLIGGGAELPPVFIKLDKNKDGRISKSEISSVLNDQLLLNTVFDKHDANKDGFLDRDEWVPAAMELTTLTATKIICHFIPVIQKCKSVYKSEAHFSSISDTDISKDISNILVYIQHQMNQMKGIGIINTIIIRFLNFALPREGGRHTFIAIQNLCIFVIDYIWSSCDYHLTADGLNDMILQLSLSVSIDFTSTTGCTEEQWRKFSTTREQVERGADRVESLLELGWDWVTFLLYKFCPFRREVLYASDLELLPPQDPINLATGMDQIVINGPEGKALHYSDLTPESVMQIVSEIPFLAVKYINLIIDILIKGATGTDMSLGVDPLKYIIVLSQHENEIISNTAIGSLINLFVRGRLEEFLQVPVSQSPELFQLTIQALVTLAAQGVNEEAKDNSFEKLKSFIRDGSMEPHLNEVLGNLVTGTTDTTKIKLKVLDLLLLYEDITHKRHTAVALIQLSESEAAIAEQSTAEATAAEAVSSTSEGAAAAKDAASTARATAADAAEIIYEALIPLVISDDDEIRGAARNRLTQMATAEIVQLKIVILQYPAHVQGSVLPKLLVPITEKYYPFIQEEFKVLYNKLLYNPGGEPHLDAESPGFKKNFSARLADAELSARIADPLAGQTVAAGHESSVAVMSAGDDEEEVLGGAPKYQPCSTNEVYKPSKKKSIRKKKRKTYKKSKKKIIKKSPKYSKRKSIKKKSFKKSSKRNTLRKSKRKSKK